MNVKEAYDNWADQYDTSPNKTRDLEASALREMLAGINVDTCLEIGCGTGKNTQWLITKAQSIVAVDISAVMLAKAQKKISSDEVHFVTADVNQAWSFATKLFDLICFSLVLEHIEDLDSIFNKAAAIIKTGGHLYIGELHPFKQYSGSKARFDTEGGTQVVTCFTHNISDFTQSAKKFGFVTKEIKEYFDDDNIRSIPRILALIFEKV